MIYLDHHAAAPLCEAARTAMAQAADGAWANPSSVHRAGRAAKALVERARRQLAEAIGAQAADLVFTAGGTEACNLGVFGLAHGVQEGDELLVSDVEHPAIEQAVQQLARTRGAKLVRLSARGGEPTSPEAFAQLLSERTRLCAVQWVNHETGTVFPVASYAQHCQERGVPFLVDASQAFGKLPLSVVDLGADAVVLTSTKVGGPGGAAALWLARCRDFEPRQLGGGQERGRRAGTPGVSALVGFGAAAEAVAARLSDVSRVKLLRDRLEAVLVELGGVVNGAEGERAPSVCNVSFRNWRGDILVAALDVEGLCASSGAACSSGVGAPSPVLRAMYPDEPFRAESALRLSLGSETSEAEVEQAIAILRRVLGRARA